MSVAGQRVHKLSNRYFRPFKLLRQIGEVAFELELPVGRKIHPIFHVSQLKHYNGPMDCPSSLPPDAVDNHPILQPLAVIDWKVRKELADHKVLIQWQGTFPKDATRESYQEMLAVIQTYTLRTRCLLKIGGMLWSLMRMI